MRPRGRLARSSSGNRVGRGENACFNELGLNAHSDLPRRIPADVIQETGQAAIVVDIPDYDGRVKNARPDIIERS
jgi:hypothetical protein